MSPKSHLTRLLADSGPVRPTLLRSRGIQPKDRPLLPELERLSQCDQRDSPARLDRIESMLDALFLDIRAAQRDVESLWLGVSRR